MSRINSPIRYFGGKGNGLREIIYSYFPNKNDYDIYIEPFAGAANLLFHKEPFGVEIYNDMEQNVYSLFKVLSDKQLFEKFKQLCDISYYASDIRKEFKNTLKEKDISILERAYMFFYVNRTSVNGVGGFSIATCIRRNMSKPVSDMLSTVDALPAIHNRLSKVIVENTDGIKLIKKYDRPMVFIYADPPYAHETRTNARYVVDMNDEQQKELIDVLLNLKHAKVLLSGYDCSEYKRLTSCGWQKIMFDVKTQDGNRNSKTKTEVLWRNYEENQRENNKLWS